MIPITANGGGDGFCLDLDPGEKGLQGQVIEFIHDSGSRKLEAPSFRSWFVQLVNGVEDGSIVYDEEWGLVSSDELDYL
jgi:cell wall assembly regulator SMI1